MSTRTPAQIAEATVEGFESDDRFKIKVKGMTYHIGYPLLKDMLIDAIEEDRAQRESATVAFVRQYGPELTDEQIDRVAEAIQWSSIPDALGEIAFSVTGPEESEDDE